MIRSLLFLVLTIFRCGDGMIDSGLHANQDVVVIAYNSYDARSETLVFASLDENEDPQLSDVSSINSGKGSHLWEIDEDGPELKRGWMFRLRLNVQAVIDEYDRRGNQDFIAIVSDASDVYVTRSLNGKTIEELKRRFMNDFGESKIVFSTQIYCCNPWELRSFGRANWDRHYEIVGGPDSMYKHLNAGLYMGYASAIIEMAEEMKLWETDYHRHESFHSLVGTKAEKDLQMEDLEVDDDEWQISAWFFRDQAKQVPLASLDFVQQLFGVTGTFRAAELDDGYIVYSRDHFLDMFGPFPSDFSPNNLDELTVCPYDYNADQMQWTNLITGGQPLMFHFAGNDWLCACSVFAAEGFKGVTTKFRNNCHNKFDQWLDRVQDGIQYVASAHDSSFGIVLTEENYDPSQEQVEDDDSNKQKSQSDVSTQRHLEGDIDHVNRALKKKGPYKRQLLEDGHYDRALKKKGPYKRQLIEEGRYDRALKKGPYKRQLADDGRYDRALKKGPYKRQLGDEHVGSYSEYNNRELKKGPYKRQLADDHSASHYNRELKKGPYKRQLAEYGRYDRALKKGPYKRQLGHEHDGSRYNRALKKGPYKRQLANDHDGSRYNRALKKKGPYKRQLVDDHNASHYNRALKKGPYKRQLAEAGRYNRELKKGPYKRQLADDRDGSRYNRELKKGPYKRQLANEHDGSRYNRELKKGPYKRQLADDHDGSRYNRELKKGPYKRQLANEYDGSYYNRELKKGPYKRQLANEYDGSYYNRELKKGPYKRQLADDHDGSRYNRELKKGPYKRQLANEYDGSYYNRELKKGPYKRQLADEHGDMSNKMVME